MITKTTRIKLIVFVVVAVLGVGYATWRYAGGDRVIGNTTYTVPMKLGDTSGIFTNAEVTYQGVKVGRVGDVRLTKTGLNVDLVVDRGGPPIPPKVTGNIANRSAVGEQYVDLRPKDGSTTAGGQTLENTPEAQRTIAAEDTTAPPPTQGLINDVNSLATSVPKDSLRTVVDEAYNAFSGTGPDLQRLLDNTQEFTQTAQDNLPATKQLLDSSKTVLNTQVEEGGNLKQFAGDLRGLSGALKGSDQDIRNLINQTPPAAEQVNGLVDDNEQNFTNLLPQTWTTSEVLRTRKKGLEQIFVVYPMLAGAGDTILDANGNANLGLALNLMNPAPCVRGYESTKKRPARDTEQMPQNKQAYCAEPTGSPINVRGSTNAPYAGKPVQVQAPAEQPAAPQDSAAGVLGIPPLSPGPEQLPEMLDLK